MIERYRLGFEIQSSIDDTHPDIRAALPTAAPTEVRQCDYRTLFSDTVNLDPMLEPVQDLAAAAGVDRHLRESLAD